MPLIIKSVVGVLIMAYPLAIYFGVHYLEPWKMAALLIPLLLVKQSVGKSGQRGNRILVLAVLFYCALAIWRNDLVTLQFYPVLMNAVMLLIFGWSLAYPPTVVERLARLQTPELPPEGVLYTRRVTRIWCVFFVVNGSIAFATAVWGSLATWSLYNGLIAYVLMGALMAGEYLVRKKTRPHGR